MVNNCDIGWTVSRRNDVECLARAHPYDVCLNPVQRVFRVAADIDAIPDSCDRMQGDRIVDVRVYEENADALTWLGFQHLGCIWLMHGVVMEHLAVDEGTFPPRVFKQGRDVLGVREVLLLNQDILAVGLGIVLFILRLDNDHSVHALGNMLNHRACAAVVHEYAWMLGFKLEVFALARLDFAEFIQHVSLCRMKVHRVRVLVRSRIDQREVNRVAFFYADRLTGNGAIESPGRHCHVAFVVHGQVNFHCRHGDANGFC